MTAEAKRLLISMGAVFAALATAAVIFVLLFGDTDEEDTSVAKYPISDSDKKEIEKVATGFIEAAGNFGLDPKYPTTETIDGLTNQLNSLNSYEFFDTRQRAYGRASEFIAPNNQINAGDVGGWSNQVLIDRLLTVEAKVTSVSIPDEGYRLNDGEAVKVAVSFDSKFTTRFRSADDTTWDGYYIVAESKLEQRPTLTLIRDKNLGWRIYAIEGLTVPASMSVSEDFATGELPTPVEVDRIKSSIKLPTPQDMSTTPKETEDDPLPPN